MGGTPFHELKLGGRNSGEQRRAHKRVRCHRKKYEAPEKCPTTKTPRAGRHQRKKEDPEFKELKKNGIATTNDIK